MEKSGKYTKTKCPSLHDDAVLKSVFLALKEATAKIASTPIQNCGYCFKPTYALFFNKKAQIINPSLNF